MKVLVNGQEKKMNLSGAITISEALDRVSKEELQCNNLVTEVMVNGKNLSLADEKEAEAITCDQVESLAVTSCTSGDLLQESLADSLVYVGEMLPLMDKTAEFYRQGKTHEANQAYGQCLEAVQRLLKSGVVIKTAMALLREDISLDHFMVLEGKEGVLALFQSMLEAQTSHDWVLLADMLEYEITPLLKQWSKELGEFQKTISLEVSH